MKNNCKYIPLSMPDISQAEIKNVINCLKSGWLSTGKFNFEFEDLLKDYVGAKEVVCVDSCTSALYLSLLAHGIKENDEVITTPLTFAATANVIVHCNAKPVFCDVDKDTFNIDPVLIEKKITRKTKAIIPVHFAGYPCDLDNIYRIADKYGLIVIEDAAHALGSSIRKKKIGSFPGMTCFSFYATKNITTGEGGALASRDKKIADRIRVLKFHGISKDAWKRYGHGVKWRYEVMEAGFKNNMSDVLASIGVIQMKRVDGFIQKRKSIAAQYSLALKELRGFKIPVVGSGIEHSWHIYPCLIDNKLFGLRRDDFIIEMDKQAIGTSVHYIPLHTHPFYRKRFGYKKGDFPVAEKISDNIVSIPLFTKMQKKDINRVIAVIKTIYIGGKR